MNISFKKMILRCGFAAIFTVSSAAIAKTEVTGQRNKKSATTRMQVSAKDALKVVKKFNNFKDFFLFADTLLPGKGYDKWALYSEKSGLSKSIKIQDMTSEGLKIYLPGVVAPFEFSNDGETIVYKDVSVQLKKNQTPEEIAKKLEKAWGGFREFQVKKVSSSLLNFWFLPVAHADGQSESMLQAGTASAVYMGVGVLWAAASALGIAIASGAAAEIVVPVVGIAALFYALYAGAKWAYFKFDKLGNEVKDATLICREGAPYLQHGTMSERYSFEGLAADEEAQAKSAMDEICKNPEAVKSFNDSFFPIKKKIFSGDASFFAEDAKNKAAPSGGLIPGINGIQ